MIFSFSCLAGGTVSAVVSWDSWLSINVSSDDSIGVSADGSVQETEEADSLEVVEEGST
jgi:hypothetical protein